MVTRAAGELAPETVRHPLPVPPMPPVPPGQFDSAQVRREKQWRRAERRTVLWSRWWLPPLTLLILVATMWAGLKTDQFLAEKIIWPAHGARFVEVSSTVPGPPRPGGRIAIVVGGLNTKSGTAVARALLPALESDDTRVFSLVYGSGISDTDILQKFEALVAQTQPRDVRFFGSSMGGDVVLNLAAHNQAARDQYWRSWTATVPPARVLDVLAGSTSAGPRGAESDDRPALVGSAVGDARAAWESLTGSDRFIGAAASRPFASRGRVVGTMTAQNRLITPPAESRFPPPRVGMIFLDCTPLSAADVRDSSRTRADALTAVTEAAGTDGGAFTRLVAEVLAQQRQWSAGRVPFLQIRPKDLTFKVEQVIREKIRGPGISTDLVKDQYGVIRRMDFPAVLDRLAPGTRIVYFLPEQRSDDPTVNVERVEARLRGIPPERGLSIQIVPIAGADHASAQSHPQAYQAAMFQALHQ